MTVTTAILSAQSLEGTAQTFAEHLPDGDAWEAKYVDGTNMNALVRAAAVPYNIVENKVEETWRQFHISETTDLIDEWEESVNLPDECSGALSRLEERRAAVISRFRRRPIVTLQDMQNLVDDLWPDVGIILMPGQDVGSLEYSLEAVLFGDITDKFVLVASVPQSRFGFEYSWEVPFTGGFDTTELECTLSKIIPANVLLLIDEVPGA